MEPPHCPQCSQLGHTSTTHQVSREIRSEHPKIRGIPDDEAPFLQRRCRVYRCDRGHEWEMPERLSGVRMSGGNPEDDIRRCMEKIAKASSDPKLRLNRARVEVSTDGGDTWITIAPLD